MWPKGSVFNQRGYTEIANHHKARSNPGYFHLRKPMPEAKQTRTYPPEFTVQFGGNTAVFSGPEAEYAAEQFAKYGPGGQPSEPSK